MTDQSEPESGSGRRTPTYQAVADELERAIAGMRPGELVASEHELVERHGVSRLTARAALEELERRWQVRRVRGAGTFVAHRAELVLDPGAPPSLSGMFRRAGVTPTSQVLGTRTRRPTGEVAQALDLDPDERVVTVTRVGRIDGHVAWYGTTHLPAEVVEGLAGHLAADASIHAVLVEHFGLKPERERLRAEIAVVPSEVAAQLGVEGRPLAWRLEMCHADRSLGRPVELVQAWLRTDMVRLRLELGSA